VKDWEEEKKKKSQSADSLTQALTATRKTCQTWMVKPQEYERPELKKGEKKTPT